MNGRLEICHVFMFIDPRRFNFKALEDQGLYPQLKRVHKGQGTENCCYLFENLYIELIWVNSPHEIRSPLIERTKLYERSLSEAYNSSPFGIAWRGQFPELGETWDYYPPYMPEGRSISVSRESENEKNPFLFESLNSLPPREKFKKVFINPHNETQRVTGIEILQAHDWSVDGPYKVLEAGTCVNFKKSEASLSKACMKLTVEVEDKEGNKRNMYYLLEHNEEAFSTS